MEKKLELIEQALVIAVPNYDPSLLNPSFLTFSGIVPNEWELARQPVVSQHGSQIIYNNGINLIAQPNRLTLVQSLATASDLSVDISEIARRYVEMLPNLDVQAVGLNFRSFVPFAQEDSGARDYLFKQLLAPGPWLSLGTAPVQAGLNFTYTFDSKRLNLSLNEAALQMPEGEKISIILFSGSFDYELSAESLAERRSQLLPIVYNSKADRETYTEVVNKFVSIESEPELVFRAFAQAS